MTEIVRPERCPNCPFGKFGKTVGGRGNPLAPYMWVLESPGKEELKTGIPISGDTGDLLQQCSPVPIDHPDLYIFNSMVCHPLKSKKDEARMKTAASCCHDRLIAEIKKAPRKAIMAMGASATWSLTGNYGIKITKERGKVFLNPDLAEYGILAAVHPAFLLRGGGSLKQFKADIRKFFMLDGIGPKLETPIVKPIERKVITNPTFEVPTSQLRAIDALHELHQYPYIAADAETSGFSGLDDTLLCLGLGTAEHTLVLSDEILEHESVHNGLNRLGASEHTRLIWHNGKFDMGFTRLFAESVRVDEDTMLLSYALEERGGFHDLEQLAKEHLGLPEYKYMIDKYLPKKGASYSHIPRPVLYEYLAKDVSATAQLFPILRERVFGNKDLRKLYIDTLLKASEMLYHVERAGFSLDESRLQPNKEKLDIEIDEHQQDVMSYMSREINLRSWQQLLPELRALMPKKKIPNTRKETLEKLVAYHPVIQPLLAFKTAAKSQSTYVLGMEKFIKSDGKTHPTFLIHGTATGRLSCQQPNLQNIPRASYIRSQWRSSPGRVLISRDLNQAELRVLGVLSNDAYLMELYRDNTRNLHDEMSDFLFGKGQWDAEDRNATKGVNFGIPYGREAMSLAMEFGVTKSVAQGWIDAWLGAAPGAAELLDRLGRAPSEGKTLTTCFGRKRRFGVISKANWHSTKNEARNMPIQSISSDINLHIAIRSRLKLQSMGVEIVNLIHDQIIMDAPASYDIYLEVMAETDKHRIAIPPEYLKTDVPFPMDCDISTHWKDKSTYIQPEDLPRIA